MCRFNIIITIAVLLSCACIAVGQSEVRRCFQYTWLGPQFDKDSVFMNSTCQDATRLARGIPCKLPLVVSYDGSWPDVSYIWANHLPEASCILADNDVCATYTYYFNGVAENSTAMCTRTIDSEGQAITGGCFEQRNGSFVTRACFCRSIPGGVPCNDAPGLTSFINIPTFVLATMLIIFMNR